MAERTYIAIDLKSFYASVECVERGLDPLTTNLVVADISRTEKTICLAVSPSLKAYGISGRARLFEVVEQVKLVNAERERHAPGKKLGGPSWNDSELKRDPSRKLDYIIATPRMSKYMEYSTRIFNIYRRYISAEDIHVYSIDEVFMDVTAYLKNYGLTSRELAMKMILDVLGSTGITATAGIAPNLYLCKVAMDIGAKHIRPDKNGVRIAELDELSYRRELWDHRPLTDFWRVGSGIASKLEQHHLYTMGDVARCSLGGPDDYYNEDLLYKLFGINAELLIDHAWGWEPCTIAEIKNYRPDSNSVSIGQVLHCPYDFSGGRLIVREMTDMLVLDLVDKGLVTDQLVLDVGYDIENLKDPDRMNRYIGTIKSDRYGRRVPTHAHGTANLTRLCSSTKLITEAVMELYDRIVNPELLVRRMSVAACRVVQEGDVREQQFVQLDLFGDPEEDEKKRAEEDAMLEREKRRQKAVLQIQKKFGKNAILKGMNYEEGATTRDRNGQIGGHKA